VVGADVAKIDEDTAGDDVDAALDDDAAVAGDVDDDDDDEGTTLATTLADSNSGIG
jgi:hypothetical protein